MVYFENVIIGLLVYFRLIISFVQKVYRADLYTRSKACLYPLMDRHLALDVEYKNPS